MVDSVINVVAHFAVTHRLADDLRNSGSGGGHHEPSGFGEDLDVLREKTVYLDVYLVCEFAEGPDRTVVLRRETATDVEQVHLRISPVLGFLEYAICKIFLQILT